MLTRSEIKQRGAPKGAQQVEPSVPPMGATGRPRRGWCRIVRRRGRRRVVGRRRRRVVRGRRRSVARRRGTIMRSRHGSRHIRGGRTVAGIERIRTGLHLIRTRLHLILLGQVGCYTIVGNALDVVVVRLWRMTVVRLLRMNHGPRLVSLSAKTSLAIEYRTNARCRSSESGESLLTIADSGNRSDHASAQIHCVSAVFKRVTHDPGPSRIWPALHPDQPLRDHWTVVAVAKDRTCRNEITGIAMYDSNRRPARGNAWAPSPSKRIVVPRTAMVGQPAPGIT